MNTATNNVLSGWFRLENIRDGRTLDFNPANPDHAALYAHYERRTEWAITIDNRVQPLTGDEPTELLTPLSLE